MGPGSVRHPAQKLFLLLLFLVAVMPVVAALLHTLLSPDELRRTWTTLQQGGWRLLGNSLLLATVTALAATLAGTVLGFLLFRLDVPFAGTMRLLLLIPLFLSPYLFAVAWKDFFFLTAGTTRFIASPAGVVFVLVLLYTPLAMLITGTALAAVDPSLEESGWLSAGRRTTFFRITLPLIRPALFSSFVLVFIFTLSEFSVPAFLGIKVFTTEIFTQFSAFYDHALAIDQSVLLLLICLLLLATEGRYLSEAPFLSLGLRSGTRSPVRGRWALQLAFLSVVLWFLLTVLLPLGTLAWQAWRGGGGMVLRAWHLLAPTLGRSLLLAGGGGLLILLTGLAVAWRTPGSRPTPLNRLSDKMLLLLFAIPSTVLGIALIHFFNRPGLEVVYTTPLILLVGYTARFAFLGARLTGNALRQLSPSYDEAARLAGAGPGRRFFRIHLPLLAPSLAAAFLLGFILSLGELGTTIMVYPPGMQLLPVKVYTIMANAPQALTSAMTLLAALVTLAAVGTAYALINPVMKKYSYAGR